MSAFRQATQIIDLFRTIEHITQESENKCDLAELRTAIQGLAKIGIAIGQNVAELVDPFSGKQPTEADTHAAYEAARAWFTDLDARVHAANGYYVNSGLPQAFQAIPPAQHESFMAAVGSLMGAHLVDGTPIFRPQSFDFAKSIAIDEMTPEQQEEAREDGNA